MVNGLRRGRRKAGSDGSSAKPGRSTRGRAVVQHHWSLRAEGKDAGTRGKPVPREHDGPEHGRSRRGAAGAGSASPEL